MFKLLFKNMKPRHWVAVIAIFFLTLLQVFFMMTIVGEISELTAAVQASRENGVGDIWWHGLWMVIAAILMAGVEVIIRFVASATAAGTVTVLRERLYERVNEFAIADFASFSTESLITRTTNDMQNVHLAWLTFLKTAFVAPITMVWSIILLAQNASASLTVVTGIWLFVLVAAVVVLLLMVTPKFKIVQKLTDALNVASRENLTGVRVVRAFARERWERDRFIEKDNYYCGLWVEMGKTMARFFSIQDILSALQVMLVIVFGCVFCVNGTMTSGDLIAFISYNSMLAWPIRRLGRMLIEMSKADVSLARIAYIMNEPEEPASEKALKPAMNGDIVFDHVSFAYEGSSETLHDISFDVEAGSTLGILGGTGSGKSTLMLLLDKMYLLPEGSGRITVGGTDIKDIDTEYLRSNISMVLQEPFLFSRTIADNIAISSRAITIDRVREASRAASLDESVREFSKGYDTFVGERGVTLSGGQKQRTAIARALVSPAPIMIFDDSLSAVDTETDAKIRGELEKRFGSSTTILISHRLTTLSKCDKIIVLDSGRVAEQGTPDELRTSGGIYQKIFEIQSGAAGPEDAAGEEA